jgi:anti-sigma regulatory factor (Ser/Thr protein kinase)
MTTESNPEVVELAFPASSRFVRLSRLAAATLASESGFDVEEVDDLRIAVDELVTFLVEGDHGAITSLRFVTGPDEIVVEGRCDGARPSDAGLSDLVEAIVSATTDEYAVDTTNGSRAFRIVKHRRTTPPVTGSATDGAGADLV